MLIRLVIFAAHRYVVPNRHGVCVCTDAILIPIWHVFGLCFTLQTGIVRDRILATLDGDDVPPVGDCGHAVLTDTLGSLGADVTACSNRTDGCSCSRKIPANLVASARLVRFDPTK